MPKIKCPHCGSVQERYPHILLCNKCFEDIGGSSDWHAAEPNVSSEETGKALTTASAFRAGMRESLRESLQMGRWLSPLGTVLKRTSTRVFKRFVTLYFLALLSLFFLMAIGIFTSMIGLNIYFPEAIPPTHHMLPIMLTGIASCLFVSFFCQAALMSALANEQAGLIGSFAIASRRIFSYTALVLVLVFLIWGGFMFMYIPGVIALVLFAFSPLIMIAENETVFGAMRKNIRYLSGMWVSMLFRFIPLALFVIVALVFYAYGGSYLLFRTMVLGTGNEFLYLLLISAIFSPFIVILAVYAFTVYEDLRNAWEGPIRKPADVPVPASVPPARDVPAAVALSPLGAYLNAASAIYRRRFGTLTFLNFVSYVPHILQLGVMLAGIFILMRLVDILGIKGDYGFLAWEVILSSNPTLMYILTGGCILFMLLHLATAATVFYLYVVLELAFVYAVADEGISAFGALRKAKKRFSRYVWVQLKSDLTISMGSALLIPGVAFMAWYSLTPYVFALEGEENVAFRKSRRYVTGRMLAVLKRLYSVSFLPVLTIAAVLLIIVALLPFYWITGMFFWIFSGTNLPGRYLIYGPLFWGYLLSALALGTALFYVPFQKVLLYVLYRDVTSSR